MKEKMAVMNRWLDEAIAEGGDAVKEHLHAIARIVGGQVSRVADPNDIPRVLSGTIEEVGKGLTAGMLMQHGRVGVVDVKMFSLSRSEQ
jgi:hypothetical protein